MRKICITVVSCILVANLMTGSVLAKPENDNRENKKVEETDENKSQSRGTKIHIKVEDDLDATVTSNAYESHGHNGYKGLLNAIDNVKDKPSGAVIADLLLTKYETHLSDDMKAALESIKEKDAALSVFADILDKNGSVTDAVYVQKEAIQANIKNLDSYKKLGKLYEKMGKTGVKLYVNGKESSSGVTPFISEGSTLVPFRAISEALKATVSWNGDERSVIVTRDNITVKLFIDSKTAYVNGNQVTLEVPATITNGSTVVPVRFVSEALKATVKWEVETQSVVIYGESS